MTSPTTLAAAFATVLMNQSFAAPIITGGDLVRACTAFSTRNTPSANTTECDSYIEAFTSGMAIGLHFGSNGNATPVICAPESMNNRQIARIVLAFVSEDDAYVGQAAPSLMIRALLRAYPCRR